LNLGKKEIFQRAVLEEFQVLLEIIYDIANCFIISRRLFRKKYWHTVFKMKQIA